MPGIEHQDRQRAADLQRLRQPAEIGRTERIDARAVDQGQLGAGVADQPLQALGSGAASGSSWSGASRARSCSMPPARATSVLSTATVRPSSTARAASLATEAVLPAPGGPLSSNRAGCGKGAKPIDLVQGVAERRDRVGRAQLAHRGEQAIAHAGGQLVMRRHPRQPLLARRRLGLGEQIAEIDLVVLDRAGDAHPAVHLLGGDDDRIGAQERAQPGHRLPGVGRGDRPEPHRCGQTWPSVRRRALGWISFCDRTTVAGRKRSMIERT